MFKCTSLLHCSSIDNFDTSYLRFHEISSSTNYETEETILVMNSQKIKNYNLVLKQLAFISFSHMCHMNKVHRENWATFYTNVMS